MELLGILGHRQRMQIDDRIEAVGLILLLSPSSDRAEVVPKMLVARGLDTRENAHVPVTIMATTMRRPCP